MDAQVGGRPILLHRGENMLHRVSTSTSSRHRASPPCVSLRGNLLRNLPPRLLSLSLLLSLSRCSVSVCVCPSVRLPFIYVSVARGPLFCSPSLLLLLARSTPPLLPLSLFLSLSLSLLVFPFTELLWLLWSEKLGQPHTCSHLSADTGEGHGPAGSNEHAPSSSPDPIIGSF